MLNRFWDRHKQLADRLRREADDARPALSSGLHQRIMQRVRAESQIERRVVRNRPRWTWALASAAVVLISAGAAWWGVSNAGRPANSLQIAHRPSEPALSVSNVLPASLSQRANPANSSADTANKSGPANPSHPANPTIGADEELWVDADESNGLDAVSELFSVAVDHVETIQKAETVVGADLIGEQLAMLDHDARIVAGWLIDPIAATLEK